MAVKMNAQMALIISAFVGLIIGIPLLTTTGDQVAATDDTVTVLGETITITSGAGQTSLVELGLYEVTFFGNVTNNTGNNGVGIGDGNTNDVNWTEAGVIEINTTLWADGSYGINYSYYPNAYVQEGTSRTLLSLIPIFFALAVLAVGILAAKKGLEDMNK